MIYFAFYFLFGEMLLVSMMLRCLRGHARLHERDAAAEALADLNRIFGTV